MRRNEEFRLIEPVKAPESISQGIRDLTVLGIVVNPKNHVPVLVTTDGTFVGLRGLKEDSLFFKHGAGYYDTDNYGRSREAQNLTGFPRAHTPGGVKPLGQGFGTSLYTALTLGAFLQNSGDAEIDMKEEGDGICSEEENRSREADAWWEAAHDKGLTEVDEVEGESEQEEDVDISDEVPDRVLEPYVQGTLNRINTISVDIERPGDPLRVDSYKYDAATENALIVVAFEHPTIAHGHKVPADIRSGTELKWIVDLVTEDPDNFKSTDQVALLGLDVRGLDVQAVNLLALAYMAADLGDQEVDALYYRWKNNLDPEHKVQQLQMFSPNARAAGLSDVIEARRQADWARLEDLP